VHVEVHAGSITWERSLQPTSAALLVAYFAVY